MRRRSRKRWWSSGRPSGRPGCAGAGRKPRARPAFGARTSRGQDIGMTADTRIEDWDSYNAGLRERGKELQALHPELIKGYGALARGASTTRHLDAKTRELIALAIAVTT